MDTYAGSGTPPCYRSPFAARPSPHRAKAGGMRLEPVPFSMLVIGVAFACHSPSPSSLRERARQSAVVIEGRVQSAPHNASGSEPYRVAVKVLDVWPRHSGGLQREQLVTVQELGPTSGPCARVLNGQRYIFFMDPTDEPLVYRAAYAPLETSGKDVKKDVGKILCEDCGDPALKPLRSPVVVEEGNKLQMKCEASGTSPLSYKWYKDGTILKASKEVRIKKSIKNSKVQIAKARQEDSGNYTCVVENEIGSRNTTSTVQVQSSSGHSRRCNDTEKAYCVNNGECYFIHGINQLSCKCPNDFTGDRCQTYVMASFFQSLGTEFMEAEELYQKRVLTITGICVALLVVGIVCVVAYCKTKKQRKKMHNHVRQNMCLDHPNRNLANGPNHPGPGPEEIPMVDYISKNVPATERVMRSGTEPSYAGSRHSSKSHNSSTRAHSATQRHEERTWSLERTDSVLSDCPSGMLSSSVGTSKCSSPACMEARARRAAHCEYSEPRRPLRYGESFDSLGDSPHSDRYVSALTTPARLSPVDFHYSLPPQVPTFQITSPNASHAMSLPPAARASYLLEEDQPLLRCYQLPLHEAQRHEPYQQRIQQQQQQQQHQRARSYLQDSAGSLPSSPYRLAQDDDEYESTQEYPSSQEQPKKSSGRWHRSRLSGHVAPRGYRPPRDLGSRSCLSDSESEEGESTPFLSMQNMNSPEPSAIYRPALATHNTRTSQTQSRHTQQHARSKPDGSAH